MKISVLDAATLGDDLDLSPLYRCGAVTVWQTTAPDERAMHLGDAEVAVLNKVKLDRAVLEAAPSLRLICVAATGYDNVDLACCRERGIALCNVAGYSSHSVAQVTVAMALSLLTHLPQYRRYVGDGTYSASGMANCVSPAYHEIAGMTWGVVGAGGIGSRVAEIAGAMGCRVLTCRRHNDASQNCVDLDTLCRESDIISLHVPLTDSTRGMIGRNRLAQMKNGVILLNVARGAVTDEAAVAEAVLSGKIGGFGCDVYEKEPLAATHPYYALRNLDQVCLLPHMAWASVEARKRCLDEIVRNIQAFSRGESRNRVD